MPKQPKWTPTARCPACNDEAIAVLVEGTRGLGRLVVALGGQSAHAVKPHKPQGEKPENEHLSGSFHFHSEPRDPYLFRKPSKNPEKKRIRFLKRRMVEKNGKGISPEHLRTGVDKAQGKIPLFLKPQAAISPSLCRFFLVLRHAKPKQRLRKSHQNAKLNKHPPPQCAPLHNIHVEQLPLSSAFMAG